ncbi:conserved putative aminotransferase class V domain-containing protein [Neospora caninum Liverpool]|uniref:Conserved putative aminotransferase class V domain-containing protein n=1 Tax=Neospora caninum (strain Liverpool) TaxID=572307 RepID=F0V7F8_NEOCL|nr:conserved putative aminotransferase class V domain-containing protein [Neospora caninum Liverpool]CBZ49649.1 conserved putative aminotransferase class V domain-containing protein [Neospora caninum Liverpool]|eukprot:XP_003879684.1 conserved putative aminotransferase class V domain-containing protein [Neospora caninum Liverpool]
MRDLRRLETSIRHTLHSLSSSSSPCRPPSTSHGAPLFELSRTCETWISSLPPARSSLSSSASPASSSSCDNAPATRRFTSAACRVRFGYISSLSGRRRAASLARRRCRRALLDAFPLGQ